MIDRTEAGYWQRPLHRRRVLRSTATFVTGGIALGLVGCGGSSRAGGQRIAVTQAPTSVGAAATPIQASVFRTGGVIQGVMPTAGPTRNLNLDPVQYDGNPVQIRSGFHYSRLFRFNSGPRASVSLSREPMPDLVSGYEVTLDGLTYTMKLQQGANFHPPLSRPLSTADVLASWQYFTTSPKNANKDAYAPIVDSLTAPDATTLVFTLKQPYAPFLNKLANPQFLWIMSQDAAIGRIDPNQMAVGTGPWIIDSLTPTAATWKRNPDYFIKSMPYADRVQLNVIGDIATEETQFAAGKLDILGSSGPPPTDIEAIQKAVPAASVHEYVTNGLSFLGFSNVQDPGSPFKDPRLRRAASVAVDRQALVNAFFGGRAVWNNLVSPGLGKWYLDPQSKEHGASARWFKQDLKTAKQLIAAAGHTTTEFEFLFPNNGYGDIFNALAVAIGRMLANAGFKITVVGVDYVSEYINNGQGIFSKGAPPNTITFNLQTPYTDPDGYLTGMLTRNGDRNHDLLDDPDLEAMVQRQRVELDENKRLQLVYDIQRAHAEKMYYPPVVYTKAYQLAQPWVQDFFVTDDYNVGTEQYAYLSVNNR